MSRNGNREAFRAYLRDRKRECTEWFDIYRRVNGCEDCGTKEGLLDFHHVSPEDKSCTISGLASASLDRIEEEIEKCVVLCRRCHKRRHYKLDGVLPWQSRTT